MPVTIMTYNRQAPFSDEFRDKLAGADHRVEFDGGLGDVLYQLHATKQYRALMACAPQVTGGIVLACHNPHAQELFRWMPSAGNVYVADCGFEDLRKESWRRELNLPIAPMGRNGHRDVHDPLPFFPSPEDRAPLAELEAFRPFIVLAPCGSSSSKMIPRAAVRSMHWLARAAGFNTVMIGRTYRMFMSGELNQAHYEMTLDDVDGHLSMVDRLTVPGVAEALRLSSAVIAPNTATMVLGQCLDRPCLLAGDDHDYKTFIPNAPAGYMFRLKQKGHAHFRREDYTEDVMKKFLGGLR